MTGGVSMMNPLRGGLLMGWWKWEYPDFLVPPPRPRVQMDWSDAVQPHFFVVHLSTLGINNPNFPSVVFDYISEHVEEIGNGIKEMRHGTSSTWTSSEQTSIANGVCNLAKTSGEDLGDVEPGRELADLATYTRQVRPFESEALCRQRCFRPGHCGGWHCDTWATNLIVGGNVEWRGVVCWAENPTEQCCLKVKPAGEIIPGFTPEVEICWDHGTMLVGDKRGLTGIGGALHKGKCMAGGKCITILEGDNIANLRTRANNAPPSAPLGPMRYAMLRDDAKYYALQADLGRGFGNGPWWFSPEYRERTEKHKQTVRAMPKGWGGFIETSLKLESDLTHVRDPTIIELFQTALGRAAACRGLIADAALRSDFALRTVPSYQSAFGATCKFHGRIPDEVFLAMARDIIGRARSVNDHALNFFGEHKNLGTIIIHVGVVRAFGGGRGNAGVTSTRVTFDAAKRIVNYAYQAGDPTLARLNLVQTAVVDAAGGGNLVRVELAKPKVAAECAAQGTFASLNSADEQLIADAFKVGGGVDGVVSVFGGRGRVTRTRDAAKAVVIGRAGTNPLGRGPRTRISPKFRRRLQEDARIFKIP